jgi:hypothetical protein
VRVLETEHNPNGLGPNAVQLRKLCEVMIREQPLRRRSRRPAGRAGRQPPATWTLCSPAAKRARLLQTALGVRHAGHAVFVIALACGSRMPMGREPARQYLAQAGAAIHQSGDSDLPVARHLPPLAVQSNARAS